ncbi:MAG: hypothetical protein ACLQBB_04355 [Solirubrobacteraceae bacterium]
MATEALNPDALAELCFRRVPTDVVPRDVIVAALWSLYVKALLQGLETQGGPSGIHCSGRDAGSTRPSSELAFANSPRSG